MLELTQLNEFAEKLAISDQSENQRETTVVSTSEATVPDEQITKEQFECVLQGLIYMT